MNYCIYYRIIMMQFQVFRSLWSVTSCLCTDKILEVAKTNESTTPSKNGSFKHTRTCLRHDVGDFHNTTQMHTQRKGARLIVVLLLPPEPCPGDAVFRWESETTLFGLPKEDTTRNQWSRCFYNTVEQFKLIVNRPNPTALSLIVWTVQPKY